MYRLYLFILLLSIIFFPIVAQGGDVYRAFTLNSYWNTAMPTNAPIDANNTTYINDAKNPVRSTSFIKLTGAPGEGDDWAYPIYWAQSSDKLYSIHGSYGPDVQIRIPSGATAMAGSDGGIIIYDLATDQVVELYKGVYNATTDTWSATGIVRFILSSNGLDKNAAGSDNALNEGHRGLPPSTRAVRRDEVASGRIQHRLECFWHDTSAAYYWPMVGGESGKGGITPEGLVLRIKPSVNLAGKGFSTAELVIAKAMQEYGCVIGDNEGGIKNSIKMERGAALWKALDPSMRYDGLNRLTWDDYEFIQAGYNPVGSVPATNTSVPPATNTTVPSTFTQTPTKTNTVAPPVPSATFTSVPIPATNTPIPTATLECLPVVFSDGTRIVVCK